MLAPPIVDVPAVLRGASPFLTMPRLASPFLAFLLRLAVIY
jgi:hypothetical protein